MSEATCPCCGHVFDPEDAPRVDKIGPAWKELLEKWTLFAEKYDFPKVRDSNKAVKEQLKARIRDYKGNLDLFWSDFRKACILIANEPFYRGENNRGWTASLGFLLERGKLEELSERCAANMAKERKKHEHTTHDHAGQQHPGDPERFGGTRSRRGAGSDPEP